MSPIRPGVPKRLVVSQSMSKNSSREKRRRKKRASSSKEKPQKGIVVGTCEYSGSKKSE